MSDFLDVGEQSIWVQSSAPDSQLHPSDPGVYDGRVDQQFYTTDGERVAGEYYAEEDYPRADQANLRGGF